MEIEGGCYCGAIRFKAEGDPALRGQCHCRECQYYASGSPNLVIGMPEAGFSYTKGSPREFRRSELESPVTREFCGECGTPILSRAPGMPGVAMIKVGVLDDPGVYGKPDMVIFTIDKQGFHHVPEGVPTFERTPGG